LSEVIFPDSSIRKDIKKPIRIFTKYLFHNKNHQKGFNCTFKLFQFEMILLNNIGFYPQSLFLDIAIL